MRSLDLRRGDRVILRDEVSQEELAVVIGHDSSRHGFHTEVRVQGGKRSGKTVIIRGNAAKAGEVGWSLPVVSSKS